MAAQVAGSRVALGLGAVGKHGIEVAQRAKAVDFFREVCRCVPWVVDTYNLQELITTHELRKNLAALFKQHAGVTSDKVVDLLIYKGRGELETSVILQHKQRHHLITTYLREPAILREAQQAARATSQGQSKFLERFFESNNF